MSIGSQHRFFTLIHPTSHVASSATIVQAKLSRHSVLRGIFATIDDNAVLDTHASAEHDCIISGSSVLGPHAVLTGSAEVGKLVFLGSDYRIFPSVIVGGEFKISAGPVVHRDIEANYLVTGTPTKSPVLFSGLDH